MLLPSPFESGMADQNVGLADGNLMGVHVGKTTRAVLFRQVV